RDQQWITRGASNVERLLAILARALVVPRCPQHAECVQPFPFTATIAGVTGSGGGADEVAVRLWKRPQRLVCATACEEERRVGFPSRLRGRDHRALEMLQLFARGAERRRMLGR